MVISEHPMLLRASAVISRLTFDVVRIATPQMTGSIKRNAADLAAWPFSTNVHRA
jgi:hypothetical protein